jgi:hypothetical protein
MTISEDKIKELLKVKPNGYLYHRESRDLEFKEQFNFGGLAEYFRDFAAFSNSVGGYIIFGVSNSPRKLVGLSKSSTDQFEKIDPEKISGGLLDIFSPDIQWEQQLFKIGTKRFGIFYIYESKQKPVIAKKDEGREQLIKSGDVFFRYAGRTQRIEFPELNYIIEQRVKGTNDQWIALMSKIAKAGPANAAILDTERGVIEKSENQILVIDEDLIKKIKFIKEGQFREDKGSTTLRLVGDVQPMGALEVTRTIQKRLTDQYPLSWAQVIKKVKLSIPNAGNNKINNVIKDNDLKNKTQYSDYNFRTKTQEEDYKKTGKLPKGITSIYNENTVNFIIKTLKTL